MSIDSAYMTHTQVQDFIFLLSTQNKLLDPFMNCHIQWQKCDCYTTLLFRLKNKKNLKFDFSRIMALYYAGRIAVPSTSKTTLHDRFTKFMKNRPSKLVILNFKNPNLKFYQL